jgi:broad specificity phosphatase PhoE
MTAAPLVNKYKKDLIIDPIFSEIPSDDIELADKRRWLTDTMKIDINSLPTIVCNWRDRILSKVLTLNKDTIIFTHFMVINSIIGKLVDNPTLLYFYPDYTSITKIIIEDGIVKEFYVGGEKKTPINL